MQNYKYNTIVHINIQTPYELQKIRYRYHKLVNLFTGKAAE